MTARSQLALGQEFRSVPPKTLSGLVLAVLQSRGMLRNASLD